tara:strand:+ start:181 stop:369 length:189 start_codon:yes stop_codon:yes gene_type:complete
MQPMSDGESEQAKCLDGSVPSGRKGTGNAVESEPHAFQQPKDYGLISELKTFSTVAGSDKRV